MKCHSEISKRFEKLWISIMTTVILINMTVKYNKYFFFFLLAMACILLPACDRKIKKNHMVIGVSYQNLQNEFIINIQDAIRMEAKKRGVELIELDAQGKAENQISQVENFIAFGVDAIILNPCDKEGSAPAVDIAVRENKPIVVVNSIVANLQKANAFVGSEDAEAGRIAASYILQLLNGKGNLAIMHGPNGHSAEVARTEGILEVLKNYSGARIVLEQTANWDRTQALALMENWLSSSKHIDAVIAQNDEMALGALTAIKAAGKQKSIKVIGIDAIQDALKAVGKNELAGTVFQDAGRQGTLALDIAIRIIQGKEIQHNNYIPFKLVTRQNLNQFIKKQ